MNRHHRLIIQSENQNRFKIADTLQSILLPHGRTCSIIFPVTTLPIPNLATTLLPINSAPSSRQRVTNLARSRSRRDGPSELERAARRASSRLLLAVLITALEGPHIRVVLHLPAALAASSSRCLSGA